MWISSITIPMPPQKWQTVPASGLAIILSYCANYCHCRPGCQDSTLLCGEMVNSNCKGRMLALNSGLYMGRVTYQAALPAPFLKVPPLGMLHVLQLLVKQFEPSPIILEYSLYPRLPNVIPFLKVT